jgi:predicted ribosomally synthesized peptide with SipW-like signal peptide
LKKRVIAIAAAAVVATSMLSAGTYAWFSSRDEVNLGDLAGDSNKNGVKGGVVAGNVDVRLVVDSYTEGTSGILDGVRITQLGDYPGMVYPEDLVILPQDTILPDYLFDPLDPKYVDGLAAKASVYASGPNAGKHYLPAGYTFDSTMQIQSVIEYSVENLSGTDVVASINLGSLSMADNSSSATSTSAITSVGLSISRLLGWDIDNVSRVTTEVSNNIKNARTNMPYANNEEFYADGPTWFFYADGPSGSTLQFVNHRKLTEYGFLDSGNIYNKNALATGFTSTKLGDSINKWADTPFYETVPTSLTNGSDDEGVALDASITVTDGARFGLVDDAGNKQVYMYLPVDGKVSIKYALALPNYEDTNASDDTIANGVNLKGNAYQYAIFTLDVTGNVVDGSGLSTDKMVAFGVQNVAAAVDSFFDKVGLYTKLQSIDLFIDKQ